MKDEMFKGLDEKLNTSFLEIAKDAELNLEKIEEQKNIIEKFIKNNDEVSIEDKDYLVYQLREMITSTSRILDQLEKEIKIGSGPRMYEVYSALVNSKTEQIKELRNLNLHLAKLKISQDEMNLKKIETMLKTKKYAEESIGDGEVTLTQTLKLRGMDIQNLISQARKNSEMNEIKVEEIKTVE